MNWASSLLLGSDEAEVEPVGRCTSVVVGTPLKAAVLLASTVVWTFPLEATRADGVICRQRRSLEDVALLRRGLVYAAPGALVPPGPQVAASQGPLALLANARESAVFGAAPREADEAEALRRGMQGFFDRVSANDDLSQNDLFHSFCLDEHAMWSARVAKASRMSAMAPVTVAVGAVWASAADALGFSPDEGRHGIEKAQAWVLQQARGFDALAAAARESADAAWNRAHASAAMHRAAHGLGACGGPRDTEAVYPDKAPMALFFGNVAEFKAELSAAQEALNMTDLCFREHAAAKRKLEAVRASAAKREEQDHRGASMLERNYAAALLSTQADVTNAEALERQQATRVAVAQARLRLTFSSLKPTLKRRAAHAVAAYAAACATASDLVSAQFQTLDRLSRAVAGAAEAAEIASPFPSAAEAMEELKAARESVLFSAMSMVTDMDPKPTIKTQTARRTNPFDRPSKDDRASFESVSM
ncbi:hypothetical protein M885DRAFT_176282 [Pelagophyceae sp. CCMP2097]|nr:hypothetical protein M885DRAFT_176282 [Pelagophyceae sp. CCMP2097]|mmetsp:Transcript_30304/g.102222  ORF Transcript_30304/g.102222 Transcript_30304/m.102222 type:complete len:477 (+) Transcript_30304:54-1484(+)